jgi:restriction system protein
LPSDFGATSDDKAIRSKLPKEPDLYHPTLEVLKALGGSGTVQEIAERVIQREGFTDEQQAIIHRGGRQSEIAYRLAWARTWLKGVGALENSSRGVWSLTEKGRQLSTEDLRFLRSGINPAVLTNLRDVATGLGFHAASRPGGENAAPMVAVTSEAAVVEDSERDWRSRLLSRLLALSPDAFERLAQRLLREAGFISVEVTGRSGDGGIDGLGVYRLSLVSFPLFFQCKKYQGSVGPGDVRDFRGAMVGRGDKGLLITTGTFTSEAMREASRPGTPPIDLVDGDALCDLLKEHGLGVTTRMVEDVQLDERFFDQL